jgi:ATP-dependent Clp protease ATP-binding subunit ClpA
LPWRWVSQNKRLTKNTVEVFLVRRKRGHEMFERLTESSRAVLLEAQDLAIESGSPSIEVGHLLYGCADATDDTARLPLSDCGITPETLRRLFPSAGQPPIAEIDLGSIGALGIDYNKVKESVEATFGAGALESAPDRRVRIEKTPRPPFTVQSKRALEQSLRVALELHEKRIRPGHLLLGLLRIDDDFVSIAVESSGTTLARLSAAVLTQLSV